MNREDVGDTQQTEETPHPEVRVPGQNGTGYREP